MPVSQRWVWGFPSDSSKKPSILQRTTSSLAEWSRRMIVPRASRVGSHAKNSRRALRAHRSDSQSELGEHGYYFDTMNDLERHVPRSTVKSVPRAVSFNQYHIHLPGRKTSMVRSITIAHLLCTQMVRTKTAPGPIHYLPVAAWRDFEWFAEKTRASLSTTHCS